MIETLTPDTNQAAFMVCAIHRSTLSGFRLLETV